MGSSTGQGETELTKVGQNSSVQLQSGESPAPRLQAGARMSSFKVVDIDQDLVQERQQADETSSTATGSNNTNEHSQNRLKWVFLLCLSCFLLVGTFYLLYAIIGLWQDDQGQSTQAVPATEAPNSETPTLPEEELMVVLSPEELQTVIAAYGGNLSASAIEGTRREGDSSITLDDLDGIISLDGEAPSSPPPSTTTSTTQAPLPTSTNLVYSDTSRTDPGPKMVLMIEGEEERGDEGAVYYSKMSGWSASAPAWAQLSLRMRVINDDTKGSVVLQSIKISTWPDFPASDGYSHEIDFTLAESVQHQNWADTTPGYELPRYATIAEGKTGGWQNARDYHNIHQVLHLLEMPQIVTIILRFEGFQEWVIHRPVKPYPIKFDLPFRYVHMLWPMVPTCFILGPVYKIPLV